MSSEFHSRTLLLSVVIPTYNESQNIPLVLERLAFCLADVDKEVIVVDDDSPDRTWEVARSLYPLYPWLKVIRRVHEKGLSSAVLKGFEIAEGQFLAVMDADLQHDEQALLLFIEAFRQGADIVVGSRKVQGGGVENWTLHRRFVSWVATFMARIALPRVVSDPMSGFFAVSSDLYLAHKDAINPRGFKILLEFLARAKQSEIKEIGYVFRGRIHGESKLSSKVVLQYMQALYELSMGRVLPTRFIKYVLVGFSGLCVVNLSLLLILSLTHWHKDLAMAVAIELSVLTNFFLNNLWTFRQNRCMGFRQIVKGLLFFHLVCLAGTVINQALAMKMFSLGISVYFSVTIGYVVAAVWNYVMNVSITWKEKVLYR